MGLYKVTIDDKNSHEYGVTIFYESYKEACKVAVDFIHQGYRVSIEYEN